MKLFSVLWVVVAIVLANCSTSNAQSKIEIGPLQSCSASDDTRWNLLETEFNGVHAQDLDTQTVAQYSAGRFGYYGIYLFPYNWLPLSDSKQTMCGRFARFAWNQVFTNENDWNIRVIPSEHFYGTFDDAVPYASDANQVWSCDPVPNEDPARHACGVSSGDEYGQVKRNCFEAEVTSRSDRFQTRDREATCGHAIRRSRCLQSPSKNSVSHYFHNL